METGCEVEAGEKILGFRVGMRMLPPLTTVDNIGENSGGQVLTAVEDALSLCLFDIWVEMPADGNTGPEPEEQTGCRF